MNFIFLSDTEMIEALVGAFGFALLIWYFRLYLGWSRYQSAGSIFPLVWIIRKIGVNFYKFIKKSRGVGLSTIKTTL